MQDDIKYRAVLTEGWCQITGDNGPKKIRDDVDIS